MLLAMLWAIASSSALNIPIHNDTNASELFRKVANKSG